jgi:hypothetical protein
MTQNRRRAEPLGDVVKLVVSRAEPTAVATQPKPPPSPAAAPLAKANLPPIYDRLCDREIPDRVLSAWTSSLGWSAVVTGIRKLRRDFTTSERAQLGQRRFELLCAVHPFTNDQAEQVAESIHLVLGSFRTVRERGADAHDSMEVLRYLLRDEPAWAIEEGCERIADGKASGFDFNYAPHNPAICHFIRSLVTPYRERLEAIETLLRAPVEAPPSTERPTREQLEQQLGRPFDQNRSRETRPVRDWYGDGKHAQRIGADLAARRARNDARLEQQQPEAELGSQAAEAEPAKVRGDNHGAS